MSGHKGDSVDVEAAIDRLYQAELAEFIDARNRLANTLRKRDRTVAAQVKKLAKPSVSAWAVNQAYWNARDDFEALLDAGETLRTMQKKAFSGEPGGDLQSAMNTRLIAMGTVMKYAEQALNRGGHGTSNAILRRVSTTLEALAAYGRAGSAPRAGRLSADVPAPGFEALAKLASGTPASAVQRSRGAAYARRAKTRNSERTATANDNEPTRMIEVLARQAQKRAHEAVAEAQAKVEAKRRALHQVEQAESAALERVYAAEKAVTAAQEQLTMAVTERNKAVEAAEKAKHDNQTTRVALAKAEEELAAAQKRLG
ncbi:MAG: hypothetical protein MJE77_41245 [Proteobacteria bacterium]|nr:hypothetical protein [Pseudomonadota bacterium]